MILDIYKGYEIFIDSFYSNLLAVRRVGETRFEYTIYAHTINQAKHYID